MIEFTEEDREELLKLCDLRPPQRSGWTEADSRRVEAGDIIADRITRLLAERPAVGESRTHAETFQIWQCPGCGDVLDIYDIDPSSVSDIGAPRREDTGNYYCGECERDYHEVEVVPAERPAGDAGLREWLTSDEAVDLLARQIYEYSELAEGATWPLWTRLDDEAQRGWLETAKGFLAALADSTEGGS